VVHLRHRVRPQRQRPRGPWILGSKPIQLSNFDFDGSYHRRREFTTDEWIDLLIQSIGFNPSCSAVAPSSSNWCG
jgi:predicted ATP-dependent Lon-type protease